MPYEGEWWTNYDQVVHLGYMFVVAGFTAGQLQDYYEKPHVWTKEWLASGRGQMALEEELEKIGKC